jgi:hypothetical protein
MSDPQPLALRADDSLVERATQVARYLGEATLFSLERRFLDADPARLPIRSAPGDLLDPAIQLKMLRIERMGSCSDAQLDADLRQALEACRFPCMDLVFAMRGDGSATRTYLGVRSRAGGNPVDAVRNTSSVFESSLPGLAFARAGQRPTVRRSEVAANVLDPIRGSKYLTAITGVPADTSGSEQPTRALERLVEGLQGRRFLLLVLAQPIPEHAVNAMVERCHALGSEIHSLVRTNINLSAALSESISHTRNSGVSVSEGTNDSVGTSTGDSHSSTPRAKAGGMLTAMIGVASAGAALLSPGLSAIGGILLGQVGSGLANSFVQIGGQSSTNQGETTSRGTNRSESRNTGVSDALSRSGTKTESVARELLDKSAEHCEQLVDEYARRLREGRSLGFWDTGIYLLTDDLSTAQLGRALLRSNLAGNPAFEPLRTVDLRESDISAPLAALGELNHPRLDLTVTEGDSSNTPLGSRLGLLATPIHTGELTQVLHLPRHEVAGIPQVPVVPFGLNPRQVPEPERRIRLGRVRSPSAVTRIDYPVDASRLVRHTFVTGFTGSGKTNTVFVLLSALTEQGIPFLVLEPAKGEYRGLRELGVPDLRIWTAGDERHSRLRVNPLQFIPGSNLMTHIDNVRAIFNAAFSMYASMPHLLERALLRVYLARGWDLSTGGNRFLDEADLRDPARYGPFMPRLSDLHDALDDVVHDMGFAAEASANYLAALKARIGSLLAGSKGAMLDTQLGFDAKELFGRPTVIELRSLGDEEEKSFLMAVLLSQLYSYREWSYGSQGRVDPGLQHVLVIEEAHRLLRDVADSGNEAANTKAKAVETFSNMLGELRQYGQGFVVVDQVASKLVPDVIKNTGLKILHQVVAPDDRDFVGDCMGLTDEQKGFVRFLGVGDAVVLADGELSATRVQVDLLKSADARRVRDAELRSTSPERAVGPLRMPACRGCPDPCNFLSSATRAGERERRRFRPVFQALLFADESRWIESVQHWDETTRLDDTRGSSFCLAAHCVDAELRELGRKVGPYPAIAGLAPVLTSAIASVSIGEPEGQHRTLLLARAALDEPAASVAGCARCPDRCSAGWVGEAVDTGDRELVTAETSRRLSETRSLTEVRDVIREGLARWNPFLDDGQLTTATYCWLVHLPVDPDSAGRVLGKSGDAGGRGGSA